MQPRPKRASRPSAAECDTKQPFGRPKEPEIGRPLADSRQILNASPNRRGVLVYRTKHRDDFADASCILVAVGDAGVGEVRSVKPQDFLDEFRSFFDVGVNPLTVLVVIGEGRMHIRQRDRRAGRDDFVWAHSHPLMPDRYILDGDAMAINAGPAAAHAWGAHNPHAVLRRTARRFGSLGLALDGCRFHKSCLKRNSSQNQPRPSDRGKGTRLVEEMTLQTIRSRRQVSS